MNNVDVTEIPEVGAFLEADEQLTQFKEAYAEVFDKYTELLSARNDALQAADKSVRARGVSCGPWDHYSDVTKYDADALYEAVGREQFLKLGGRITTVQKRELDRDHIRVRIEAGELTPEVVERVRKVVNNYHAPKKMEAP